MGGIEKLPVEVIHLILSFLHAQEAAKTSVLSKLWLHAWKTQPILHCDQHHFPCREKFVNFVCSSLVRYQEKKISLENCKLKCRRNTEYDWTSHLERWIGIAMEIGLKKLELDVPGEYSLPSIVFEAKLLEDLSVCYGFGRVPLVPKKMSCLRLKRLSFYRIYLDEETVENILSSCQYIEFLNVSSSLVAGRKLRIQARNILTKKRWRTYSPAANISNS